MPEYLAPGVYVEETSFRSKSIEGVSTSTTAFVGLTSRGPIFDPIKPNANDIPEVLTSFADFESTYERAMTFNRGFTFWVGSRRKSYFCRARVDV